MKKIRLALLMILPVIAGCSETSSLMSSNSIQTSIEESSISSESSSEVFSSLESVSSEESSSIFESSSEEKSSEQSSVSSSLSDYEKWANSSKGQDLNRDGKIDTNDYELYQTHYFFEGRFTVNNFKYVGDVFCYGENCVRLDKFGTYLSGITFSVNAGGLISGKLSESTIQEMGSDSYVAAQLLENAHFDLVDNNYVISSSFKYKSHDVPLSLTFTKKSSKVYSTSFDIAKESYKATISFIIVYK